MDENYLQILKEEKSKIAARVCEARFIRILELEGEDAATAWLTAMYKWSVATAYRHAERRFRRMLKKQERKTGHGG